MYSATAKCSGRVFTPASNVKQRPSPYDWMLNTYYRTNSVPSDQEWQLSALMIEYLKKQAWTRSAMDVVEAEYERFRQLKAHNDPGSADVILQEMREIIDAK